MTMTAGTMRFLAVFGSLAVLILSVSVRAQDLLLGGPIHESDFQPGERVLEQKHGGAVVWVPGYWNWNEDRSDYLWMSGFWRVPPPGRHWLPGFYRKVGDGYQWVPGMWTSGND
jgi:WXXGXW repeat (2 copies)